VRKDAHTEGLLRELAPRVLGTLVRRHGQFDVCEDAVQEALLAAALQWPERGVPDNPWGWLITVASRRMTDQVRSDAARRLREETVATRGLPDEFVAPSPDDEPSQAHDDTLTLLFMCCHPALTSASQVALTLRAVGGLTTAEIARAFLVPETKMAGPHAAARSCYRTAARRTTSLPERRYLQARAVRLVRNEHHTAPPDWTDHPA